jgi:peroxiredoxin
MTAATYNLITLLLGGCLLVALAAVLFSFIAMIVRWKSPQRRGHGVRLLLALAAIPCLIGIQQAVLWWGYLPALARQQMAQVEANRAALDTDSSLVHLGDAVPGFSLQTVDGETFSLPELEGKVVLINFFATWCGPCQTELPHIEQLWKEYGKDDGFRLLVIGREETADTVRQFRQEHGFTFPIAADPERNVFSLFAENAIPRTLIVSPEGKIVYSQIGFREQDLAQLKATLSDQLRQSGE